MKPLTNKDFSQKVIIFITLIFLSFIFPKKIKSQENEKLGFNRIELPPAPNAASLGEYGIFPVSKASGTINISVPITKITAGNINIPVYLSYNSGGIKVQDEPGCVGLGWTLSAGGVITRTVRGKADEVFGYLYNASKVPTRNSVYLGFVDPNKIEETFSFINRNSKGLTDFEPDLFNFNFGNFNGTFYISQQGIPELFPPQDLNIQFVKGANSIDYFVIRDNSGLIYYFGRFGDDSTKYATETSIPAFSGGGDGPQPSAYMSAWYLVKIIDPLTGNEVNFEYTEKTYDKSITYSSSATWENDGGAGGFVLKQAEEINTLQLITNVQFLKKITWNNEVLDFYSSNTITGCTLKLDSIIHKNTIDNKQRTTIFGYTDFSTDKEKFRYKLDSLVFKEPGSNGEQTYFFSYVNQKLPSKDSKAIDHWGYYNGKSNSTLLPDVDIEGISREYVPIADRNSDGAYSGAEMLKSITYPTGGTTTFEFESNTYMRKATLDDITIHSVQTEKVIADEIMDMEEVLDISDYFDNDTVTYYNFYLHGSLFGDDTVWEEHGGTVGIKINGDNFISIDLSEVGSTKVPIEIEDPVNDTIVLFAIITSGGNFQGTEVKGWLTFKYYNPDDLNDSIEQDAGGQRIKKISNYDPVTKTTTYKEYDYLQSGYLSSNKLPEYMSGMTRHYFCPPGECPNDDIIINITSSSHFGLGTVAYRHVREYFGIKENNIGYTDTYFKKVTDNQPGGQPYLPIFNKSWERALSTREITISKNKNDTVKEIFFHYTLDTAKSSYIRGFKSARVKDFVLQPGANITDDYYSPDQFSYQDYTLGVKKYNLTQQTSTDYTTSGNLTKTIKFKYDNPFQSDPTGIETTNSDGKTVKTVFKYPSNFVSDCYQPCLSNYKSNVKLCDDYIDKCIQSTNTCASKWSGCYSSWLQCVYDNLNNNDDIYMCFDTFDYCLEISNYFTCLDTASCNTSLCYDTAFVAYQECKQNIWDCAYNKYENATDPFLKAVYLMYLANVIDKPVETLKYVDGELVEDIKNEYKIYDDNDTVPLLYLIQSRYDSTDQFVNEIKYEKYKNKLPAQVNLKDSYMRNVYLWSPSSKKLVAYVKNAETDKVFYESFEESPDGAKFIKNGINMAKTGEKVLLGGSYSFPNDTITPSNEILMSYWYYKNGKWHFKEEPFSPQISVNGECIDEIRVYPKGAEMTTYSYDGLGNLVNSTDPNGLSTTYEYDELGRLTTVRDPGKNIVKHFEYNYGHE